MGGITAGESAASARATRTEERLFIEQSLVEGAVTPARSHCDDRGHLRPLRGRSRRGNLHITASAPACGISLPERASAPGHDGGVPVSEGSRSNYRDREGERDVQRRGVNEYGGATGGDWPGKRAVTDGLSAPPQHSGIRGAGSPVLQLKPLAAA